MNHGVAQRKLSINTNHRKALLKNLARSLILHGHIVTTMPKAKTIRPVVEKLITRYKKYISTGLIYHLRAVEAYVGSEARKVLHTRCEKFVNRNGGYTRIIHTNPRVGDNAPMSYIGFVE